MSLQPTLGLVLVIANAIIKGGSNPIPFSSRNGTQFRFQFQIWIKTRLE
jgi:hypothetical protein